MLIILGTICILIGIFLCLMIAVSIEITKVAKTLEYSNSPYSVEATQMAAMYIKKFGDTRNTSFKNLKIVRLKVGTVAVLSIVLGVFCFLCF